VYRYIIIVDKEVHLQQEKTDSDCSISLDTTRKYSVQYQSLVNGLPSNIITWLQGKCCMILIL